MAYAGVCWRVLTLLAVDASWRMLTYAGVCWRMLTLLAVDTSSAPMEQEASTILVLSNLASEEELNNEQDATDIMEDTKEKCEKDFGGVDAALLITPGTGGGLGPKYVGKTMIRFNDKKKAYQVCSLLLKQYLIYYC